MLEQINPFDTVSGKVVINHRGTFWFKEPGINTDKDGWPIYDNLHREDGPAYILNKSGISAWYNNGKRIKEGW